MEHDILFVGDYCPIGRNEALLANNDFSTLFGAFKKHIDASHYSVVNLECPITNTTEKIFKTGPCLKSNNKAIEALKYAGFDLITLANNHILDYGEQGVLDTIDSVKQFDFKYIGAGKNRAEAKMPHLQQIKDFEVGFLTIAENEFCAATNNSAGAYTVDLIDNVAAIKKLRKQCETLVLIYHGGREHYQLPTPKLRERLRFYASQGVDAIIVHHPHCFGGYEYYNGSLIAYSLGNFVFDYKKKYQKGLWTEGIAAQLSLHKNKPVEIEVIPFKQGQSHNPNIEMLSKDEVAVFKGRLKALNEILVEDAVFNKKWEEYVKGQSLYYTSSLTVQNDYIRAAINKKLLPNFPHSNRHLALLLNLMRCETHSEIAQEVLSMQLEKKQ